MKKCYHFPGFPVDNAGNEYTSNFINIVYLVERTLVESKITFCSTFEKVEKVEKVEKWNKN
jgi:hypothetical protein